MDIWSQFLRAAGEQCVVGCGLEIGKYEEITEAQSKVIRPILEPLSDPEKTILDYGCGPGRFLTMFAEMFGSVTGYDPCTTMLIFGPVAERIKRRCHVPPDEFDVVFCWGVFGDPDVPLESAADDLLAHLKTGGAFLFADHCEWWEQKNYRWQFRRPEFYLDLFARHGMTLRAVGEVDQNGRSITIFTGMKS